jgi:hypothetical protein
MDETTAAAVAAAAIYGRVFGPFQTYLVEAVVAGFAVRSRWKRLVNLGVGVALADLLMAPAAHETGNWWLLVVGLIAGILASAAAAQAHDQQAAAGG